MGATVSEKKPGQTNKKRIVYYYKDIRVGVNRKGFNFKLAVYKTCTT